MMSQRLLAVLLVVLVAVQSQYGRPAEAFTAGAGNIGNRKRMETVKDEAFSCRLQRICEDAQVACSNLKQNKQRKFRDSPDLMSN